MAIIKIIFRSCGNYKNRNQVLWHTLGQFPQSRLGRLHDCPRFQKVSANLTIFELKFSTQFLVVAGPLPCWRSVIDTFLPTQSSSLIGQSLMLRPIPNKFIYHDNDHQVPQMIIIMITTHGRCRSSQALHNNHYYALCSHTAGPPANLSPFWTCTALGSCTWWKASVSRWCR